MAEVKKTVKSVGDIVLSRVNEMSEAGFTLPADYNPTNAIKASMLVLQEIKDKNGKPALEVCTQASIQAALFKMLTFGEDVSKVQGYFITYGTQLQYQESYFGKVLRVRRIFPEWTPVPMLIHEGDSFEYAIDPNTGRKKVLKHEQKLENIDKPIIGGYLYIPCADGGQDLYVMTAKEIAVAHSKSRGGGAVHKQFSTKMYSKTLVSSGCNYILNSTPSQSRFADNSDDPNAPEPTQEYADAEEVVEVHELPDAPQDVVTETGEIKAQAQEQSAPSEQDAPTDDDSDF